jgi:hypothetical protein
VAVIKIFVIEGERWKTICLPILRECGLGPLLQLVVGTYFQLVVETEFEPVDDDFELPTDDGGEDDEYTDGIEIGVDISEIDAIMDLVDGDEPSEEIIEENFEIGIDE